MPVLPTESNYKDRDTEEFLDIYFYRPVGSVLALSARRLGMTPNAVTVLSMVVGVAAGHLFYYRSLKLTALGILLFILSDALDSADGQLARLTGVKSMYGRILDGLAGNIVFISVYLHICLRYVAEGSSMWIFALALAAGFFHSLQAALADFYRNIYLLIVRGAGVGEIDGLDVIQDRYRQLNWKHHFKAKLLLLFYLGHIHEQEAIARQTMTLRAAVTTRYGTAIPRELRTEYQRVNQPMIKYYNLLTINTRVIVLFICLLLGVPYLYFVFELVVLNLLFLFVIVRQEQTSQTLLANVKTAEEH